MPLGWLTSGYPWERVALVFFPFEEKGLSPPSFERLVQGRQARTLLSYFRPQIGRDYPLNLSISLSGGKETNKDSPSNGE